MVSSCLWSVFFEGIFFPFNFWLVGWLVTSISNGFKKSYDFVVYLVFIVKVWSEPLSGIVYPRQNQNSYSFHLVT